MARRLIRKEGMLVGGSAGSAVWAAVQMGKKYENLI
jgi:cysteine synthase